ncbi:MAG: HAD-IIIC family phosphatase [Chitinispirillia bacterium]|nr:HAD-IIIC family phosphatase [Chitinispirillia bacterium]
MSYFVFRNYTVEPFFKGFEAVFSGYGDVSSVDAAADTYIWFYLAPYKLNNDIAAEEIGHYGKLLDMACSNIPKDKIFILFTMPSLYKINYVTSDTVLEDAIEAYNHELYAMAAQSNIKIIDISGFFKTFADECLIDWKYYFLSQMPIDPKLAPRFGEWFSRQIEIIAMKRKKCIILDLDNTLWSGISGEDGVDGIKMGEDYPGNAFRFFQSYLLELNRKGIILTICSKNNESDVMPILENHPDMLLKKEHFSAYRINWDNKADNIIGIARELNIGLDSMVFVDDNPAERELIRQAFPQVAVPEFPIQPYHYPAFINMLTNTCFSAYALTQEDADKTRQYKENSERAQHKTQFTDMDAYLRSLEIKLTAEKLNEFNRARFAQMTQKTNQFNLTTKRYTETEIQSFADNGGLIYGLRVSDKFGDNGLTGLIIITINGQTAYIDTLLLSCRVLGRGIESAFTRHILAKLKIKGITRVDAAYIKTDKNIQVENFYDSVGFTATDILPDRTNYILDLRKEVFTISDVYNLEDLCGKE